MHSMKLGIEELLHLCFKTYEWETVPEHRKHFRYVGRKKKKHINYTTCNQYEQFIYSVYLIHVCVKYLSFGIVFYCNVVILLSIWGITASMKW